MSNKNKKRVNVYIDWFNLYHAVHNLKKPKYKWLNLRKLVWNYIDSSTHYIKTVHYFSALASWNPSKQQKHKKYIEALKENKVTIRMWEFRQVDKTFYKKYMSVVKVMFNTAKIWSLYKLLWNSILPDCLTYKTHEEKKTDVTMALQILEDAFLDRFDEAIIISWDSDIVPAIVSVRKLNLWKKFISVIPIRGKGKYIKSFCDKHKFMTEAHIQQSLLPQVITKADWTKLSCPSTWI